MTDLNATPLVTLIADLDDPRRPQAKRHSLANIIIIAVLAVICGADSWTDVELFGQTKRSWWATFLDLSPGIPSPDTLGRVFAWLDAVQLEERFARWAQSLAVRFRGHTVAIDGKTARRSHQRTQGLAPLHLVSAWAEDTRWVLAHHPEEGKSNEITAIPELLQLLALEGCIVTIDAMGCPKRMAQAIRQHQAD